MVVLVIMVNKLEDHCIQWNNQTIWPTAGSHGTQCHLVAGLFFTEVYTSSVTSKSYVCSSHNEIFHLILRYLRCSLNFKQSRDDFGGKLVNGTWTGVLALFDRKEADFIPHIFSMKYQRELLVEFSFVVPQKELLSILSFTKHVYHGNPLKIFNSFSPLIWLLISITLLLYGTLNFLEIRKLYRQSSMLLVICTAYDSILALLLGQGSVPLASWAVLRLPLILLVLSSFVLRQLFSSDITALLLSRTEFTIDNFDQLRHLPSDYRIILERDSSTQYFFHQLFQELKSRTVHVSHRDMSSGETLDRLVTQSYVAVINRDQANVLRKFYSSINFHVSRESLISAMGNYAVRKTLDADHRMKLNRLFKWLYQSDLNNKVDQSLLINQLRRVTSNEQSLTSKARLSRNANKRPEQAALTYFYIYCLGIATAIFCFLLESFFYYIT